MDSEGSSFEEMYSRLQQMVATLEAGGLSLEEAIDHFQKAMELAGQCMRVLDQAELRVTRLVAREEQENP